MQGCGFKDNGRETGGAGLAEGARTTGHDLARPRRGLPGEGEEGVALVSSQVTATRGRPLDIVASFSRTPPSSSSHHHHLGFYRRAPPPLPPPRRVSLCLLAKLARRKGEVN